MTEKGIQTLRELNQLINHLRVEIISGIINRDTSEDSETYVVKRALSTLSDWCYAHPIAPWLLSTEYTPEPDAVVLCSTALGGTPYLCKYKGDDIWEQDGKQVPVPYYWMEIPPID